MTRRKSWADQQGFKTGVFGEIVDGITICEANRATVYERYKEGIEELYHYMHENYKRKGIKAVLFGVDNGISIQYAVFCQSGFLRSIDKER